VFAVTGGADGIGFALAQRAAELGMRVALLDVRPDAVDEAVEKLRREGGAATGYPCDVTDPASLTATAARLESAGEVPAILWINAGVGTVGGFLGAAGHDIEWVYAVNVLGAIHTARAFVPSMLDDRRPRHIGITASVASIVAAEHVYGASKHAVLAVGEALRAEVADRGVGVTLLLPGHAQTRIWDGARARPARFGGPAHLPEAFGEPWLEGLTAQEIAGAAFDRVAGGGGYCVLLPTMENRRVEQFEARNDALRRSIRV
jgi:NAD(P)-dependent dehydrogenase (short-subunit alcohol dehydrogenase family)